MGRFKKGLMIAAVILVMLVIAILVILKVYVVENVVVEGNELYTDEQIQEIILNDDFSWNSIYVVLKYKFKDIGEVPFVDTMDISMTDPKTIHIKVYEKGVLGYLYIESIGQNAYFDKDGFVVETSTRVIEDIPKITGISCDEVTLYEQLPIKESDVLKKLLTLTQALNKYHLLPEEINYDQSLNPILYYESNRIQVIVGSEDMITQKVIRLSAIMPQLNGLQGTLHMETWTPQTTDIIFDKQE